MLLILNSLANSASDIPESALEPNDVQNPLIPKRTQVAFSGSGAANFVPRNLHGEMAGPPPPPTCQPKSTQVGFQIRCVTEPETKGSSTCNGTLSFYGFNETRSVSGEIMASPNDVYVIKLRSSDGEIDGCQLSNVAPVSASLGNAVSMPGCGLSIGGCSGDITGAGADHNLTTSASVIITPIE